MSREPIGRALADARAHPSDATRVGQLGKVLQAWDQFETAAAVYARARALERRYEWYYLEGVTQTRLARHAVAATLLRDAVALSPTLPAKLALADALFESGAVDESEPLYRALATEPPAEPHARYGLGRVLAARGEQEAALREFDAAISLYAGVRRSLVCEGNGAARSAQARRGPRRAGACPGAGRALACRRRSAACRACPPCETTPVPTCDAGWRSSARATWPAPSASTRQPWRRNPALSQAHVNLISLYGQQGAWEQAETHYREAVRLGFAVPDAHYNYGVLLLLRRREEEAATTFRLALAANPEHAGAWNNLGQVAEHAGRWQEALEAYRHAVERAPDDSTMRFNMARMLIATKQYTEAIPQLQMLSAVKGPLQPRYMFGLATAWVHAGDLAKGRQYASEARALAAAQGQRDLVASIDRQLANLPQ